MTNYDQIIGWVWIAIAILISFLSLKMEIGTFLSPGPGLFPFVFSILLGSMSIINLVISHFKKIQKRSMKIQYKGFHLKRPGLVLVCLFLYASLLTQIGYLITTFLLFFILFKVMSSGKGDFKLAFFGAFATVTGSYIIFNKLLQIPLPKGILGF